MYPSYRDPLPAFQYLGGAYGKGLLESALAAPQHTLGGQFLHRTVFDKAASLLRSLVKNHPLLDGNKRLALTSVTVFLALNGYVLCAPHPEAVAFTLRLASERDIQIPTVSRWLRHRSVRLEHFAAQPEEEQLERLGAVGEEAEYQAKLVAVLRETIAVTGALRRSANLP